MVNHKKEPLCMYYVLVVGAEYVQDQFSILIRLDRLESGQAQNYTCCQHWAATGQQAVQRAVEESEKQCR
jgi:hypothetical protein